MTERTAEQIYSFIEYFRNINDVEPKPDDIVTYYCDHKDERGFVENIAWKDGGFEKFIAKKWILQKELDELFRAAEQSVHPTVLCTCPAKHYEGEVICHECGLPISHSG